MMYDLEGRTEKFSTALINFCYSINLDTISKPLIDQLIRAGTSVGANYREANQAFSKNDFKSKIKICQKEASETRYWLELVSLLDDVDKNECQRLNQESYELTKIFGKISSSLN